MPRSLALGALDIEGAIDLREPVSIGAGSGLVGAGTVGADAGVTVAVVVGADGVAAEAAGVVADAAGV
ncbi:MAG: hypothetical protein ABL898_19685, partial [Hyphomicrobiaceae bacterium]